LYRHASFYVVSSADVMSSLKLGAEDLPAVFMVSEDDEGVQRYTGEILELNLSEWVLKHSSPGMGELTLNSASGKGSPCMQCSGRVVLGSVCCCTVCTATKRCLDTTMLAVLDMLLSPLVYV
jgi:hypothetical protein